MGGEKKAQKEKEMTRNKTNMFTNYQHIFKQNFENI